jgi:hypothetical protein
MAIIDRLFLSPAAITSFWSKGDHPCAAREAKDGTVVSLEVGETIQADWQVIVRHDDENGFVYEKLRPFFPSRSNIREFNSEVARGCRMFRGLRDGSIIDWPENEPLLMHAIESDERASPKSVLDDAYREVIWRLLADEWGMRLPLPEYFGSEPVRFQYDPNLPCAATMIGAVQCIIEAILETRLALIQQASVTIGQRRFDIMDYRGENGVLLTQQFDITDVFGRNLPMFTFDP